MGSVTLKLDEELVALLRQFNQPVERSARELIVFELYRQGSISGGKAAQLLRVSRLEFIQTAARLGLPYFSFTEEEWQEEVAQSKKL